MSLLAAAVDGDLLIPLSAVGGLAGLLWREAKTRARSDLELKAHRRAIRRLKHDIAELKAACHARRKNDGLNFKQEAH
jgi:hypothetical protein